MHLYQLAVQNRASHDEPARNRPVLGFCAYRTLDPAKAEAIAVANENFGILGLAKFCDSLANGGKHWLQVDRRARDDLENVTGRGLIIENIYSTCCSVPFPRGSSRRASPAKAINCPQATSFHSPAACKSEVRSGPVGLTRP